MHVDTFLYTTGLVDRTCYNDCGFRVSNFPTTDHFTGAVSECLCHHSQWVSSLRHLCHGETLETQTNLPGQMQWSVIIIIV